MYQKKVKNKEIIIKIPLTCIIDYLVFIKLIIFNK